MKEIKVNAGADGDTKWSKSVDNDKVNEIKGNYETYIDEEHALEIGSAAELAAFAAVVNGSTETEKYDFDGKYVKMTSGIDLKGRCVQNVADANQGDLIRTESETNNDGKTLFTIEYSLKEEGKVKNAWSPIGTSSRKVFKGTFDGDYHEITNMVVLEKSASSDVYAGLFGYVDGATIKNIGIDGNSYVVASSQNNAYAGGIVGYSSGNIEITSSYVKGQVSSVKSGAGGLVVYKDAEPNGVTSKDVDYIKESGNLEVPIAFNGNTVDEITAAEAGVSKPNFREDFIVSGSAVIFKGSYLEKLDVSANAYKFTVTYEPQGKPYNSSTCTAVEGAPATTAVNITVKNSSSGGSGGGEDTDEAKSMENCNY